MAGPRTASNSTCHERPPNGDWNTFLWTSQKPGTRVPGSKPMPPPSETTIAYISTHHPPNLPAQGKVILDLLKGLEHKGHCIYMDNWFNSSALVSKLSQLGFGACGTVGYTTRGIPDFANPKKHPMKRDADPQFYQEAGQLGVVYGRIRSVSLSWQTMVIAVSPRNRSAARRVRLDIVSKKNHP